MSVVGLEPGTVGEQGSYRTQTQPVEQARLDKHYFYFKTLLLTTLTTMIFVKEKSYKIIKSITFFT